MIDYDYNVKDYWEELKKDYQKFEEELELFFINPNFKKAGVKHNKMLIDIGEKNKILREKLMKIIQDINSDYS